MKIAKKVIFAILIIFFIAGIYSTVTKGINVGLLYREREQIGFILGTQFDVKDIKEIAQQVFKNEDYIIQKATIFEDTVIIQNDEITQEELKTIVEKVNEKYKLEIKTEEIEVEKVGAKKLKEDLTKYILPSVISIILIMVYIGFRFKKTGIIKNNIRFITTVLFLQLIYISILSITQIQIGRVLAPLGFSIYIIAVLLSIIVFEKERKIMIASEENKKK